MHFCFSEYSSAIRLPLELVFLELPYVQTCPQHSVKLCTRKLGGERDQKESENPRLVEEEKDPRAHPSQPHSNRDTPSRVPTPTSPSLSSVPFPQVFVDVGELPPEPLLPRLSSPSSLSIVSEERCSRPFSTLAALCWTFSSMSMSVLS